jgi:hypothetical protein
VGAVQSLEHRPVSSERRDQVIGADLADGRDVRLLAGGYLDELEAPLLRPAPEHIDRILDRSSGMDDDTDALHDASGSAPGEREDRRHRRTAEPIGPALDLGGR